MSAEKKREKYDKSSPGTRALVDEIVHGTFVKEGTMVAFPTCLPGATAPIRSDESHIRALDIAADGLVYGGTSGQATHLFVGMFHGVTGNVFDMGVVEGADECTAVCCGSDRFIAGVNGSTGGRIVSRGLQPLPFDLIQEWGFGRRPFDDLGLVQQPEPIVHARSLPGQDLAVGITTASLFTVDLAAGEVNVVGKVPGNGQLAVDADGRVLGRDEGDALWVYEPEANRLERGALSLPAGSWDGVDLRWARDARDGRLMTADGDGRLFAYRPGRWSECVGQIGTAPVGPMAITCDGRLFGFSGEGMSRLFRYDPDLNELDDLGVAASVFERRRYGYSFGDAVVGRDGQIIFGEDDDLGHLWIYFPRIRTC